MEEDGVLIETKKLGRNSPRFCSKVAIKASLDDLWRVLTDYDRMVEFLPSVSIGRQDLALGLKISSKMTLDCNHGDVEVFDSGKRREIDFKMFESDFAEILQGKWSVEQMNKRSAEEDETTVSYVVDIKLKVWIPMKLVQGRFSKVVKMNHSCIRDEVMRLVHNSRPSS